MTKPERILAFAIVLLASLLAMPVAWSLLPTRTVSPSALIQNLPAPLAERPPIDFAAMVRAPLFNEAREAKTGESDAVPQLPPPALVGIIGARGGSGLAIVLEGGQQKVLRVGQESGGWRLVTIARSSAHFFRGAERQVIRLIPEDYRGKTFATSTLAAAGAAALVPSPSASRPPAIPVSPPSAPVAAESSEK